jgi:hypothetical protein
MKKTPRTPRTPRTLKTLKTPRTRRRKKRRKKHLRKDVVAPSMMKFTKKPNMIPNVHRPRDPWIDMFQDRYDPVAKLDQHGALI